MSSLAPAFRAAGGAVDDDISSFSAPDSACSRPVDARTDLTLWAFLGGRWSRDVLLAITAADAAKQRGNEHFAANRLDEAALAYTDALSLLPEDKCFDESRAIYCGNRAACYVQQAAFASALDDCNYSLSMKPKYVKVLMRRAAVLDKLDKLEEALADWNAVLAIEPCNPTAQSAKTSLSVRIQERNEKMKAEMLDKLKGFGNMILGKFGLSLDNFKMQQDPNTASTSNNSTLVSPVGGKLGRFCPFTHTALFIDPTMALRPHPDAPASPTASFSQLSSPVATLAKTRSGEIAVPPPKFILLPQNRFKVAWEMFVILPVLYTVTAMPVNLFYLSEASPTWDAVDLAATIIFAIDIVICFVSAYTDSNGVLVTKPRAIAIHYLCTWFVLDLVSVLPFDQLIGSSSSVQANKLFRLGRIVRIMRLLRLIRLFQLFRKGYFARVGELLQTTFVLSGPVTRLFKLFLLSILVAHLVGGLWFFIGDLRESGSWLDLDPTLRSAELSRQYFASVYWAFITLSTTGYGDFHGTNTAEYCLAIVVVILGQVGAAVIVGDVLNILSSLDLRLNAHKERMGAVQQLLLKVRLPPPLRRKLLDWATDVNKSISSMGDVMPMLSPELRREVVLASQEFVIRNVPLLNAMSQDGRSKDLLADMLYAAQRYTIDAGVPVWYDGQKAQQLMFLVGGRMEIYKGDDLIDTVEAGSMVGEFEVVLLQKCVTDCVSVEDCDVVVVDAKTVEEMMSAYPYFSVMLREVAMDRLGMYGMRELAAHHADGQSHRRASGEPFLLGSGSFENLNQAETRGPTAVSKLESVPFPGNQTVTVAQASRDGLGVAGADVPRAGGHASPFPPVQVPFHPFAEVQTILSSIDQTVHRSRSPPFTIGEPGEFKRTEQSPNSEGSLDVNPLASLPSRVSSVELVLVQLVDAVKALTTAVSRAHGVGTEPLAGPAQAVSSQLPAPKSQGAFNRIMSMQQGTSGLRSGGRAGQAGSLLEVARAAMRAKREAGSGHPQPLAISPALVSTRAPVPSHGASVDGKDGSIRPSGNRGLSRFRQAGLKVIEQQQLSFLHDTEGFTKRKMSSYGKSVHRPHKLSFMPKDTRKTKRGGGKAAAFDDADELRAPVAEEEDVEESGSEESTHEEEAEAADSAIIANLAAADMFNEANVGQSKVHVRVHKRNGRSFITTVQGLAEDLDTKKILKAFRKNFHCNGALVEDKEKGEVVQLQGDQRQLVKEFLVDQEICRDDEIILHGH